MYDKNDAALEAWKIFKETHLITKVNFILRFFGWAIIFDDKCGAYPIRVR